jgi:glyoxylase-like metal-dependent hydrolase (beta-lactamase superfamily II)
MKEISENVVIDASLSGVTVGVIKTPKGVIFIDSPLTPKDVQSWRTTAMKNDSGPSRVHILLDEHFDRTACAVPIKSPVFAHEKTSKAIQSRPTTFRFPASDTGSEWELYPEIGPMQWINPEITFTQSMKLELDDDIVVELDYHPGPSKGAIWVGMPYQKIVFIGDAVIVEEPPFLENADIDLWLETLELLKSDTYKDYTIISGRSGVIERNDIQEQIKFLNFVQKRLEKFSIKAIDAGQVEKLAASLLETFPTKTKRIQEHYKARLKWGINQYYGRSVR